MQPGAKRLPWQFIDNQKGCLYSVFMPDTDITIREFKSADEFRIWWTSPEVEGFYRRYPEKLAQLKAHQWVSPWLAPETKCEGKCAESPIGKAFGKYIIENKLGQGGMGVVYLAHDPDLNRRVALKLMLLEDEASVERFSREARASAKLKHSNIIQVYEIGLIEERHYFTMEYIDGESLDKLIELKDERLSPRRTAEIIRDIAMALDYAHKQDIIHRDIKPANILIDKEGRVYLTDFGLAKELSGTGHSLTMSGTIVGTADYMSPEQAMALKDGIDYRTDVFSLGATLYHALTGQAPFKGEELYKVLESVVRHDPIAPSRLVGRLSKDIETICLKCLEKEPHRRYQSAGELAEDLNRFINGEAIAARPVSLLVKIQKKAKKNKIAALALTAVIILLTAGVAAIISSSYRQQTAMKARMILDKVKIGGHTIDEKIAIAQAALKVDPALAEAWEIIGDAYADKNDYQKALASFSKAIELNPAMILSYYGRGYAAEKDKNLGVKRAVSDYQKVIELAPDSDIGYVALGVLKFINRDFDLAIKYFDEAIKIKPSSLPAYERRAICHLHTGRLDLALADWNKAELLGSQNSVVYEHRGFFYINKKEFDLAIKDYNRAIEIAPFNDISYHQRGFAYETKGEFDKALADFNKAIELNPKSSENFNERGVVYFFKGELDKAILDYNRALELAPRNAVIYDNRSQVYVSKGEMDRALADLNQTIKLDNSNALFYKHRGYFYLNKKEEDLALVDLSQSINLDPKDVDLYYSRSTIYRNKKEFDKALADLNKIIELNPTDEASFSNRGIIYLHEKNDPVQAIADFTKSIALKTENPKAYYSRGLAYIRQNKLKQAIDDFTVIIGMKLATQDVRESSYMKRGEVYYQIGSLDQALADFTQAIKINPKNSGAYNNRGFVYDAKKEYAKGLPDYAQAIYLDPNNVEAYFNRACSYGDQGRYKDALADGEAFLKLAPNHTKIFTIKRFIEAWEFKLKDQK